MNFRNVKEKKVYRRLEKLQWRVLALDKIRVNDNDHFFDRLKDINRQIECLQKEIDGVMGELGGLDDLKNAREEAYPSNDRPRMIG